MDPRVVIRRMDAVELSMCMWVNRACARKTVEAVLVLCSRLGGGVFWYVLIVTLPLYYGSGALPASARLTLAGALGILVYKQLKGRLVRQRPYVVHDGIRLGTPPLDVYSFPSGHTLHAVSFTLISVHYYPHLLWWLWPFATLVALSRVALGLHYPSDVAVGAGLGCAIALAVLSW